MWWLPLTCTLSEDSGRNVSTQPRNRCWFICSSPQTCQCGNMATFHRVFAFPSSNRILRSCTSTSLCTPLTWSKRVRQRKCSTFTPSMAFQLIHRYIQSCLHNQPNSFYFSKESKMMHDTYLWSIQTFGFHQKHVLAELQHLQADVPGAGVLKGPGLCRSLSDVGRSKGRPSTAGELWVTMAAYTWEMI